MGEIVGQAPERAMPNTVTVPDVLKGHAAEIWRAAFLSSYDGTCKERGDQRDSCAASIAWSAVKAKYQKNAQDEWVEKAGDPTMGPVSGMNMAEFPSPNANVEQTTKPDPWLDAFMRALDGECSSEEEPWECAKRYADAEVAGKPEGEKLGMTEESTVSEPVGKMRSLHANDFLDLPLPLVLRKGYTPERRAELASMGQALPDGSYPIADREDLLSVVVSAYARVPEAKREQVKGLIRLRAVELGAPEMVPVEPDEAGTQPVEVAPAETPEPEPEAEVEAPAADEPAVEKSAPALTERGKRRLAEAENDAEVARTVDLTGPAKAPDGMFYDEWYRRAPVERTVGAQLTERALARAYDEAVENSVANGWTALHNPVRNAEYFFQRYVETPDGLILTRSILTRKSGTMDWRLRELTRGAALSLAVQIPADERRQGDPRPFDILPSRGGPGSGHFAHEGRPGQRGGSAPGEGGGPSTGGEGGGGGKRYSASSGDREARFRRDVNSYAKNYTTAELRKMQDRASEALATSRPGGPNEARLDEAQYVSEVLTHAVGKKEWADWEVQYPSWMREQDDLEDAKASVAVGGEAMLPNYNYSLTPSEGRQMAGLDFGGATEDVRADFEKAGGYPGHITAAVSGGNLESAKSFARDAALSSLATVIEQDWGGQGKGVNFAAQPYLEALASLDTIRDAYGADSGKSVVAYFLANAGTWKGPTAKLVKAELNRRLKA